MAIAARMGYAAGPNLHQDIVDRLAEMEGEVHGWDKAGSWELTATVALGIIGLVITLIQTVPSFWIKIVTAILGFVSGSLVLVNQNCFDADHRAYHSLARQSKQLIKDFRMEFDTYPDPLPINDFKFLCGELKRLENNLGDLQRAIFGKNAIPPAHPSAAVFSLSLVSSAYAVEGTNVMPDWAKSVPSDAENIYFVGVANDRTATGARDAAQQQAQASAKSSVMTALQSYPQVPAEDVAGLADEISNTGEVVSTFVVPNASMYRGYALVRVSRALTAVSVKTFFLTHGLPLDPKLLDQIATGSKTKAAAVQEANAQNVAATKGVAFIQVAVPQDRAIGEALRQAISEIVSAPGVEVRGSEPANTVRYFNAEDAQLAANIKDVAEKRLTEEGYAVQLQLKDGYAEGYRGVPKHQVEVWLAPIPQIAPRVYLDVDRTIKEKQSDKLERLKQILAQWGYETKIDSLSSGGQTRLFYYKSSDAPEAGTLNTAILAMGIPLSRDLPSQIPGHSTFRPRHFDLRLGPHSLDALK